MNLMQHVVKSTLKYTENCHAERLIILSNFDKNNSRLSKCLPTSITIAIIIRTSRAPGARSFIRQNNWRRDRRVYKSLAIVQYLRHNRKTIEDGMISILLFLLGSAMFQSAIAAVSNVGRFSFIQDVHESVARLYRNRIDQVEYFLIYAAGEDSAGRIFRGVLTKSSINQLNSRSSVSRLLASGEAVLKNKGTGTSKARLHFRDTLFKRLKRNPATILNWALASRRPQKAHYIVRDRLPGSNRPAAFIATMGKRESPGDFIPVKP